MGIVTRYPFLLFLTGMAAAIIIGVIVMIVTYTPPQQDVILLLLFMACISTFSLISAYVLYRLGIFRHFQSLGWTLTISVVFTVLIVVANVWIVARLMFINEHDFALVTSLLVFGGLIAITYGTFVGSALSEGIHELAEANQRLAKGDLTTRLVIKGSDEVAQLAHTFNQMADRLYALEEQKRLLNQTRRDLVAWVSHDLRTPLTAIRVLVEAILDGVAADPETVQQYLRSTEKELRHLDTLIDDLFELAQLDANQIKLNLKPIALHQLVEETLEVHRAVAGQRGIRITEDYPAQLPLVFADAAKIQRVIHNLLDNALRHTPDGGEICIRLRDMAHVVEVGVWNMGSQIPEDALPHIFERFYRVERSRTQQSGTQKSGSQDGHKRRNIGLGLTVAHGLVKAHGGRIWAASGPDGTSFKFTLHAA
jgi:signal transduction histidine kinase